jgi:hypothetical protein
MCKWFIGFAYMQDVPINSQIENRRLKIQRSGRNVCRQEEPMNRHARIEVDSDVHKGAVEGPPSGYDDPHAPGLDEWGLPNDEVAIAQDVLGANEDQTQG